MSFLLLPVVKAGSGTPHTKRGATHHIHTSSHSVSVEHFSQLLYDSLHLKRLGLSREALLYACRGQQKLSSRGKLDNPDILTVCDFSQSSENKRMYIIDIKNYKVLMTTYVAHGRNSGLSYARKFSNRPESRESSLGFYITGNIYSGEHGMSLRLTGMEHGFNDNAEKRGVVVHGADYIGEDRKGVMGRSYGCPAVPEKYAPKVISLIKEGTCLFIYHPTKKYLKSSKILNG
ncbi:MAG: murein L,D-transpeptidase catalytic domain family protein [Flavisolibacter sp.]